MNKEFPCKCGHSFLFHDRTDYGFSFEDESWCIATGDCECLQYISSNLKYLEQCFKKSKRKK